MSGSGSEKTGLTTVLAEENPQALPLPGDDAADQLELLSPLRKVEDGEIARERGVIARGPGRPQGAKNKNTEAWREYLLTRGRSPLVVLSETFNRPAKDLARELGCSTFEAFKIQLQAAKELAPYVHQKMPLAIDTGGRGLIQLSINTGSVGGPSAAASGIMPVVNFINNEMQQNQEFTEIENLISDAEFSDVTDQAHEVIEENETLPTDLKSVGSDDQGGQS